VDPLFIVAVLALLALIVLAARRRGQRAPGGRVTDEATLEARLAAGEIDSVEFEHLRSVLRRR
jgi:uncharacterized membrane protein